jgi:phosphate transport system permease protein
MSTRTPTEPARQTGSDAPVMGVRGGHVGRRTYVLIAVVAVVAAVVAQLPIAGANVVMMVVVGWVVFAGGVYGVSRSREGRRKALDRAAAIVATSAFLVALLPLISVIWTVVVRGIARLDGTFFTETMRNVIGEGGGALHAMAGTLIITLLTAIISVPIGILVAIYLVEYGKGRLARTTTLLVDVMTGIPSIVAGLFAVGLFAALYGAGTRSGFAGAVALSILMVPVVVRGSEEMLRLVPNELREAAYGLGVPKWRTIVKIVLPTAIAGILTSITLAIARIVGETAPLLLAAGLTDSLNLNPFQGRMSSLPLFSYYAYQSPGVPPQPSYDRGWAAALLLMMIVGVLFAIARLFARILRPKGEK